MPTSSVAQRLHAQLWRIIHDTTPGARLPSEPYLAEQLGVSRATLREAMRAFETQGLIRRRQGSGTYVNRTPHVIQSGLEVLESIETMARRDGIRVDFGRLEIEQRPATIEERQILDINLDQEIISIARSITIEDKGVAYLIDILPDGVLPRSQLSENFRGSVLDLLLQRGEPALTAARTEINAVQASSLVARALGIQRGDVLLMFTTDLFTADGKIINHSTSYFLPGHFRFQVNRRVEPQLPTNATPNS